MSLPTISPIKAFSKQNCQTVLLISCLQKLYLAIFEEFFIRVLSTTLRQIFYEIMLHSKVILKNIKSMTGQDDTRQVYL